MFVLFGCAMNISRVSDHCKYLSGTRGKPQVLNKEGRFTCCIKNPVAQRHELMRIHPTLRILGLYTNLGNKKGGKAMKGGVFWMVSEFTLISCEGLGLIIQSYEAV